MQTEGKRCFGIGKESVSMNEFTYYIPTKIMFGPGTLSALSTVRLPGRNALIVITAGKSVRANGYLERVQNLLAANGCRHVVYDRILPNPIHAHVMEGAALARQHECDFVIGLGGGSPIDSAKAIAVMATNPGDYWDYVAGGTGKGQPLERAPLPVVAITTTAGTGTEADPWTVITHEERQEKIGFGNENTFPVLSIVDPELMLTVPPLLTAYQGFDAFFHAAEGYLANIATPISDAFALQSLRLLAKSLSTAVADGQNLAARTDVALANTLSGMVESTSCCTSEHSLAHSLSACHPEMAHGAALLAISEAYFNFFADKVPERFCAMAQALGRDGREPQEFIAAMTQMQSQCGVRGIRLSDFGVTRAELPALVENAFATMGGLFVLDRYTLSRDDALGILTAAYR